MLHALKVTFKVQTGWPGHDLHVPQCNHDGDTVLCPSNLYHGNILSTPNKRVH